jgi:hypothetical protein
VAKQANIIETTDISNTLRFDMKPPVIKRRDISSLTQRSAAGAGIAALSAKKRAAFDRCPQVFSGSG